MSSLKRHRWAARQFVPALLIALAAGGCSATTTGATKAGGNPEPLTLSVATNDFAGRRSADQIEEFARQANRLSGGRVQVNAAYEAAGANVDDWDQAVAKLVIDGEHDLGLIPARAWDLLGVNTLTALNTPFLVDSMALSKRVVENEPLATDLMAGLKDVGVTGLALLPEDMRHVFSLGEPMLEPKDFTGALVRSPASKTAYSVLEALGANVSDAELDANFAGAETSFALAASLPGTKTVVGNQTFFPKVNVLVVNSARWAAFSPEQKKTLQDAAVGTRLWAGQTLPTDAKDAQEFCQAGGTVVVAEDTQLAALRNKTERVREQLMTNQATASAIERIEQVKATTPPDPTPVACTPASNGKITSAEQIQPEGGALPNGTYRVEHTDEFLRAHGLDDGEVRFNHGVWTYVLRDGHWMIDQVARDITSQAEGIYQVKGDRVFWKAHDENTFWELTWSVDKGGDLHFKQVNAPEPPHFAFDIPWTRIR